jgi:hypothetical protein
VDTQKAKVAKQAQLIKDSSNDEDADLFTPVEELHDTLQILKGEHVTLDAAYKQDLTKLDVLINRLSTLFSETTLWEGTVKAVKATLGKQKRAYRKRNALGTQFSSSEPDLSNVKEWVLLNTKPRTAQQRVRDPLQHMNVYNRLSCMWASQPMEQVHPFTTAVERSFNLDCPQGRRGKTGHL